MKSLADLTLVFSAVKDACGCCVVCAAREGEACGKRSSGHLSCSNGLRCDSGPGKAGGLHSLCMCASSGPVCGSDGRTYPSICRLRAENRRAELGETSPVFLIQRGRCDSGAQHPGSIRYKFNFIADVVDKIVPAVQKNEVSVSSGSGFIVSEDGWIVTNAHVLTNKQRIKVELKSGVHYEAAVRDVDQKMDIALIKIDPDVSVLLFLQRRTGARGHSPYFQSASNRIPQGMMSNTFSKSTNNMQTGWANSPLEYLKRIKARTKNTLFLLNLGLTNEQALLSSTLVLIRDLKEREPEFPDVSSGVYIYEVIPGTAASRGGMTDHDVIIGINGHPVHTTQEVSDAVKHSTSVFVLVRRKDGDVTLMIIPEETD
uniref:HtrA serine peptidase 4 n=1 Tax=Astatotilapia calliptera TaxID=8154 RepID=A0AAX7T2M3_ASTCA